jgi:hypothetical protein
VGLNAPTVEWFGYQQRLGAEDEPARPILQVVLESPRRRCIAYALFDSGSDRSFLPPDLARRLGVMPRHPSSEARVFGAMITVGKVRLGIDIPSRSAAGRIERAEFLVPVPEVEVPFVVLGRNPAFERFEVRFRDWQRRFGLVERRRYAVRA